MTPDEKTVVRCFNTDCRTEIGRLIEQEGICFLQINGLLLREAHGICIQCGSPFHWSVRDQMFEKLIGRVLNGRNLV
jgi:hypothetical protein